jgi:hypothetical protein
MTQLAQRIYMDAWALCRPFDDQAQMRIRLETDAIQLILSSVRSGRLSLAVSPVHVVEINAIDFDTSRELALKITSIARAPATVAQSSDN